MRSTISIAALFLATSLSAAPVITSVTPSSGPVAGGTTVTIKGAGFSDTCVTCSPPFATPEIWFGETPAESVKLVDGNTIEAVTPPHPPARVGVRIHQYDGSPSFTLTDAFEFTGQIGEAFDPFLFPIFTLPVKGAFGSEFHTRARLWNESRTQNVSVYGVDTNCYLIDPPISPLFPWPLQNEGEELQLLPGCTENGAVGHLFWVAKGTDSVAANLRVTDVTRQADSHGVQIPVVHRKDFHDDRVALLGVPVDARYRLTLRIYGLVRTEQLISISVNGLLRHQFYLQPSASLFEPAYAQFTDFPLPEELPAGQDTIRVVVDASRGEFEPVVPIWAFITVTNNETQQITTVTPN